MNENILIVDDEEGIRMTFASFLTEAGYHAFTAKDYDGALSNIAKYEYDLVFLDIVLEGGSGLDLLREVKTRNPNCSVVMITGYPELENTKKALRYGANDYLTKPVEEEELLRVAKVSLTHKALVDENEKTHTHLEAIFRSVKDAIISVDKDQKITGLNKSAENICGLSSNVLEKTFDQQVVNCGGRCFEVMKKTIEEKKAVEIRRFECRPFNRSLQILNLNASPLVDQQGRFLGSVLVIRDETKLAKLEKSLLERKSFHKLIGKSKIMEKDL